MNLRDCRDNQQTISFPLRSTRSIDCIALHHSGDTSHPLGQFHYEIDTLGKILYKIDSTRILHHPSSLDICLLGNFDQGKPTKEQLAGARELFSFLLLPRLITPKLSSYHQVIPYSLLDPNSSSPGKTWPLWKESLFAGTIPAQPELLAEYQGQKILHYDAFSQSIAFQFKNTGAKTWHNSGEQQVNLYVLWEEKSSSYQLRNSKNLPEGSSLFYDEHWIDQYCPCTLSEQQVKTGQTATFVCPLNLKNILPGQYREDFGIAMQHEWIDNIVNGNKANKAHCWVSFIIPPQ